MILCTDVGNTHIVFALYDGEELRFTARLMSDSTRTEDQYAAELLSIMNIRGISADDIEGAVIGSVVPPLTTVLSKAITMVCGEEPLILGPGVKTGLNIRLDNPAECGADLVAGAVAAKAHYPLPVIIVDLGTASKVTAVGREGDFLGGSIMPGVRTSMNALVSNASLLTDFELGAPVNAIGRNTPDCLRSGAVLGFAFMIDGMCRRFREEIGGGTTVVSTGGLSRLITPYCETQMEHRDDLVTEGLRLIYMKNK